MSSTVTLLSSVVIVMVALGDGSPCPYWGCQCSYFSIYCINKDLKTLPPLNNGTFTQTNLDISNTYITIIKDGQLSPYLQSITSHNTPLADIETNAFNESSATLQTLDIQDSQLDHLPVDLSNLPHLTSLVWSGNPTSIWNTSILTSLGNSVESLTVDRMGFTTFPNWIKYFHKLSTLYMMTSNITTATDVPPALYSCRESLSVLSLYSNGLAEIPDLSEMIKLQKLFLGNNRISDSLTASLPTSLQQLYLYGNNLTEVPLTVSTLGNLTYMDLSGNRIKSVENFTFPSSLQRLHLHFNEIENISSIWFHENRSDLTILWLANNPIKRISHDAFHLLSHTLTNLYLQATHLTRLPMTLNSLNGLTYLDLSNIPTLKCTCEESRLVPWYHRLTSRGGRRRLKLQPGSDCEGVTVDYFLGTLAKSCPGH